MTLQDLMQLISERWPCTEKEYPSLAKLDEREQAQFKRRHVLAHAQKALGRLAAVEEKVDHGQSLGAEDAVILKENAAKVIIDAMQFANVIGCTEQELLAEIERILKENN